MSYYRRVVKRRPASLTDEEWLSKAEAGRRFFPDSGFGATGVPSPDLDRTVLCFWCREYHKASEVELCMALPEKRAKDSPRTSSTSSVERGEILRPFPELWAFLTALSTASGAKRPPGKLSLSLESSGFRMTLTDEHSGQYASLIAQSLDDLFLTWELALAEDKVPWRESTYTKGRR